jgi:hypothetical protein
MAGFVLALTGSASAAPPVVELESATSVGETTATVNGKVNPEGVRTRYYFYVVEKAPNEVVPCETIGAEGYTGRWTTPEHEISGTKAVKVSASIGNEPTEPTPLTPGVEYCSQITAYRDAVTLEEENLNENSSEPEEEVNSAVLTFKTLGKQPPPPPGPLAITEGVSNNGFNTATLNGTVDPEGTETDYWFEYGKTTSYGSDAPTPPGNAGVQESAEPVSVNITGLESDTTYHYRLVAKNVYGTTSYGTDRTFSTLSGETAPAVLRDSATGRRWIFYRGKEGAIWLWSSSNTSPLWTRTRVTAAGVVAPGTSPSAVREAKTGTIWVDYVNNEGTLDQVVSENNGATWPSDGHMGGVAAEHDSSPVSLRNPTTEYMWTFYIGSEGAVYQWRWNTKQWIQTRITEPGLAAPGTSPEVMYEAKTGTMWVHFVNKEGTLDELWSGNNGETWPSLGHMGGVSAEVGSSPAGLRNASTEYMWVFYVGSNGAIYQWRWNTKQWVQSKITNPGVAAPGTSPSVVSEPKTNTMWVRYVNKEGTLDELWSGNNGETWPSDGHMGGVVGEASTGIASIRDSASEYMWTYYIGSEGSLYQWQWNTTQWSISRLNIQPAAAATSPAMLQEPTSRDRWLFYVGSDHAIYEWMWNGSSWGYTSVTLPGMVAAGTTPAVLRERNIIWVNYVNTEGTLNQAVSENNGETWPSNGHMGGAALEADSSPVNLRNPTTEYMWIFYVGSNGAIYQWRWNTKQWVQTRITEPGLAAPGTSPEVMYEAKTGTMWVHFVNKEGTLDELWSGNNGETWPSLGHMGGVAAEANSSPVGLRNTSTEYMWTFYIGSEGAVYQWRWNTKQWVQTRITEPGLAAPGTSPEVMYEAKTGTMWVHFVNKEGTLDELWSGNNGETWPSLGHMGGAALEANSNSVGMRDAASEYMWINYIGHEGEVDEWQWNTKAWSPGILGVNLVDGAPENTARPTVSPTTPTEGIAETATTGTWANAPTSYSYQWERCNTAGESCATISGANSATYTPVVADVGYTLVVKVTAANGDGTTSASSTATGTVKAWPHYTQTVDSGNSLNAVSCIPATTDCVVSDSKGNAFYTTKASATSSATWTTWKGPVESASEAVDCPSSSVCLLADGGNLYYATSLGGSWTLAYAPSFGVDAISCASSSFCVDGQNGAGYFRYATNPASTSWTLEQQGSASMNGVSCMSSSFCAMVSGAGYVYVAGTTSQIESSSWTATDVDGSSALHGVACASTTSCLAVDGAGNVLKLAISEGKATATKQDIDGTSNLTAITCASSSICVTVDSIGNIFVTTNGGTSWTKEAATGTDLTGVSCASTSLCAAVDTTGKVTTFNP